MKQILNNVCCCDACNTWFSSDKSDTYESWNFNHKRYNLYVDCPKCNESNWLKTIKEK